MEIQNKRIRIIQAAEKLFSEQGYEGTSTREISKVADANISMINYYFGSKEGVFMEIISNRIKDFNVQLKSINEDKIAHIDKLLRVVNGYAQRILSNVPFHRMLQRELSLAQRPYMFLAIKDAMLANVMVIDNIINEGISNGEFRKVDSRMLIATIVGTISNVVMFPFKVNADINLDINIEADRNLISARLTEHLNDLIKTYLTHHQ
ncbi:TetR/AcrR family transcriptional regulator [Pedobacter sp.]|uniref:TetR/AcrR family transcriptional regulator n=1 Tax=Pedobacter sp. TaxID=1411316 RepID=UPI003D7FF57A